MLLQRIYNDHLAQASYMVGCQATGKALIIDPNRDIDRYIDLAAREELHIAAVTETHIHADFVSGARELASRTGAALYLSGAGPDDWKYSFATASNATLLRDGDRFDVGNIRIEALHTPGHTPEHLCFVLTDTAAADEPMGIFTGDFVFVGDVGRPDLLERAAGGNAGSMNDAARDLFRSLRRFRSLQPYLQVWPGHGAGSACGRSLGAVPQSTVGYELRFNWAFQIDDEATFVEAVLADQPPAPRYFAQMKRVNKEGPRPIGDLPMPEQLPNDQLQAFLDDKATVIDMRAPDRFAAGHVAGTLNLPCNDALLTWAGWLVPYDRPVGLIVDQAIVENAVNQLRLIGIDNIAGFWSPDVIDAWGTGTKLAMIDQIDVDRLHDLIEHQGVTVLDVRAPGEFQDGHVPGAHNIPLYELDRRLDGVRIDRPIAVHCESGTRSAIAASVLTAHGSRNVFDLRKGFRAWRNAERPVE